MCGCSYLELIFHSKNSKNFDFFGVLILDIKNHENICTNKILSLRTSEARSAIQWNDSISRAEAFGIIMKMRNVEVESDIKDSYTDKLADWQAPILAAWEYLGILDPKSTNNKFNPNQKLTRDEMAKFIIDVMKLY